ncbi:MAG: MBL fold metallo-hydrolase [Dysgonamonadaceae bacterium]|jgi:ribonuclease J|nr:MBL fold metallo-hydrolase [Dysgonamonadaceae bacterium]
MKITIHRGIDQIGGCITEIATETTKIFIDLGHNLPEGGDKPAEDKNANSKSIEKLTKDCNAIFYTHYHGDHIDLYKYVPENIPQYIGEIAKQVMISKSKRLAKIPNGNITEKDVEKLETFKTFKEKDRIEIGDISVTPYFVSHSACDSYMFLIEANGKNILHTGDFREHGYLGKGLIPTLETYITKQRIDVLIIEGTMLSRLQEEVKHEKDLKTDAIELFKKYKYSFVFCSSTDIDRLASFHEASKKCGRSFLCDNYQKEVLDIFTKYAKSDLFKFDNAYFYKHNHEKQFELIKEKGFCLLIRSTKIEMIKELLKHLPQEETLLIYSMWDGYINENVKKGEHCKRESLQIWNLFKNRQKLHTSGHATPETLTKVCQLVNPRTAIIPIHSEHSADIYRLNISAEMKKKIICQNEGENNLIFSF